MFDLSTRDVKYLPGVGPKRAAILNKELNIYSLRDLLYYFPYKYVDRSRLYFPYVTCCIISHTSMWTVVVCITSMR